MQSTDMKVAPSTSNITTGTCSSKVASVHIYCVDNNYKEPSIDLQKNQQNKNTTEKLYSDNINEKNKKRRVPSRTTKIKDINMTRKLKAVKTMYQRKNRKLYIF